MNEWAVSSESSVRAARAAARAAGWRPYVLDGKGEGKGDEQVEAELIARFYDEGGEAAAEGSASGAAKPWAEGEEDEMWRAIPQAKLPCGWLQLRQPNGEPAWVHLASAVYSLSRPVSIPEEASLDSTVPLPPFYEAALRQVRGDGPAAAAGEGAVGGGGDGKTGGGNGGGGGGGAASSVSQPRAFAHRVPSSLQWLVSQPSSRQEQDRERRGETQSSQRLDTGAVWAEAGAERRPHWSDTQRHKTSCSASGSHTSTPSILASRVAGAPTVVGPARRRRGGGRERQATERRRRRVGDRRQAAGLAAHRVGRQGVSSAAEVVTSADLG